MEETGRDREEEKRERRAERRTLNQVAKRQKQYLGTQIQEVIRAKTLA